MISRQLGPEWLRRHLPVGGSFLVTPLCGCRGPAREAVVGEGAASWATGPVTDSC